VYIRRRQDTDPFTRLENGLTRLEIPASVLGFGGIWMRQHHGSA
jgi:hypothetical protein